MRIDAMNVYGTGTQSFLPNTTQVPSYIYHDDIGNIQSVVIATMGTLLISGLFAYCISDFKIYSEEKVQDLLDRLSTYSLSRPERFKITRGRKCFK